jgi:hypothetical protein
LWGGLEEEQMQFVAPELGSPLKFRKQSEVFVIKAVTHSLTERSIYFYDHEFNKEGEAKIEAAKEHYKYLKLKDDNAKEGIANTKEFNQASEFFTKDLFWKEGNYDLFVLAKIQGLRRVYEQKFTFTLNKEQTSRLHENREKLESHLKNQILSEPQQVIWNYVFPDVVTTL